jgi:hypothetical protein
MSRVPESAIAAQFAVTFSIVRNGFSQNPVRL